jgi:hypothetical protein
MLNHVGEWTSWETRMNNALGLEVSGVGKEASWGTRRRNIGGGLSCW